MRGRLWLHYFTKVMKSEYKKYPKDKEWNDPEWTKFMRSIMDRVANKMNCYVARLRPGNKEYSGEYLNIDAFFIDNAEYELLKKGSKRDPFVLPRAVVELENSYNLERIAYALWKILCIRAPIRVLICYQNGISKIKSLIEYLESVIWQGSLMKGTDSDLIVIIGNDSLDEKTQLEKCFTVLEWRNERLEKIEELKW